MASQNRIAELDVLRGIAAICVVIFHYTSHYDTVYGYSGDLPFSFEIGRQGVRLFFVISGFVIAMTLKSTRNSIEFFVNRFSRLYPTYWSSILFTTVILIILPAPGLLRAGLKDFLMNFTMFQEWWGTPHIDTVYWTLTLEMSFYIFMLAVYSLGLLKRIELIALSLLLIQMALLICNISNSVLDRLFVTKFGNLFVAGLIFFKIKETGGTKIHHTLLLLCLVVQIIEGHLGLVAVFLFIVITFYLLVYNCLRWIVIRPLMFFGTISYALYLIHQNVGFTLIRRLDALGTNIFISMAVAFVISATIATLITYFLEKPFTYKIRRKFIQKESIRLNESLINAET